MKSQPPRQRPQATIALPALALALFVGSRASHAGSALVPAGLQQGAQVVPAEQHVIVPRALLRWAQIELLDQRLGIRPPPPAAPELQPDRVFEIPEANPAQPPGPPHRPSSSALLGSCAGYAVEPALSAGFLGLADTGTLIPPDTMGAVGPAHVVTMINGQVRIADRLGNTVSTVSLTSFWAAVGGSDVFDPRLLYDRDGARWIATACADRQSASSRILFAMSAGSDPTGTWGFYAFDGDAANTTWVDFPGFGFNSQWIAVTANMFSIGPNAFQGVKLWAVDRATALAGGPLTVTVFATAFDITSSGGRGASMQPCVTQDVAETTLYLLYNNFSSGGVPLLRLSRLTGTGAAPVWSVVPGSSFTSGGFFAVVNNFSRSLNDAPQLGDPRLIETNDGRLSNAVVRNGSVWCVHPGDDLAGTTAAYWYQIDPGALPAPIVQSGVIHGGAGVHHYYPSLAVNCAGDACVGFTRSAASRHAQGAYALRLAGDPAGTMGPVRVLEAGEDWYFKDFGSGRNRWGDYSATVVDPVDDQAFWTVQEYARPHVNPTDNGSRWGTWWGRIGSCGQPTIDVPPDSLELCAGSSASFSVAATASNAPLAYQWRKNGVDLAGQTSSTLLLAVVAAADAGLYDVRVLDGCGSTLSTAAVLIVRPALTITQPPLDQATCPGGSATFSVAASGQDPLSYQWRKNGLDLAGETSSTLVRASAAAADAGLYDVRVVDGCTMVLSAAAELTVLPALTISQPPLDLEACPGGLALFSVSATGQAPLAYQWRRNGSALGGEVASALTIDPVTPAAAGSYDVVVTGADGCSATSAPATLGVLDPVQILVQPLSQSACRHRPASFGVLASGPGPLAYQWRKNGNNLAGENASVLTLDSLTLADAGSYDVVVSGANGCSSTSAPATLTVVVCKLRRH